MSDHLAPWPVHVPHPGIDGGRGGTFWKSDLGRSLAAP